MTLFYILVLYMEAHSVRHVVPPCLFHCSPVHHFPYAPAQEARSSWPKWRKKCFRALCLTRRLSELHYS